MSIKSWGPATAEVDGRCSGKEEETVGVLTYFGDGSRSCRSRSRSPEVNQERGKRRWWRARRGVDGVAWMKWEEPIAELGAAWIGCAGQGSSAGFEGEEGICTRPREDGGCCATREEGGLELILVRILGI